MKRQQNLQIFVLLLTVALFIYFGLGWIAVALYIVVLLALYAVMRFRKQEDKPQTGSVEVVDSAKLREESIVARRREQGEKLRAFAIAVEGQNLTLDRLAKRLMNWHLEYSRANGYYDKDLYDFVLEKCKAKQKVARAPHLRRELKLSIDIIRQFMRGRSVEEVIESIKKEVV